MQEKIMNKFFVPIGDYQEIIDTLGQWKILSSKDILEKNNFNYNHANILKKLRKLEKHNFLKSFFINGKGKWFYLSSQGLGLTEQGGHEITSDIICHDIITSQVLKLFLKDEKFCYGRMFHKIPTIKIYPDADVLYKNKNQKKQIALEIELTQKSEDRVKRKFALYALESPYSFVIFITNKKSIFNAYNSFLSDMVKKVREKVLFILSPDLRITNFNFDKTNVFFNEKEEKLEELLN